MRRLFQFIYLYRAFFTFLVFEIFCAWIIVSSNHYQSSAFFNSSNALSADIFRLRSNITKYFNLSYENNDLSTENAFLRQVIAESVQRKNYYLSGHYSADSILPRQYNYLMARVINNSVQRSNNYITIDKGSRDGIEPGMGVISSWGIVGRVKACSRNFSTIYSLLHSDMLVSSLIKSSGVLCTTSWTGNDPMYADLLYVPRHIKVVKGDSVITSGYNSNFPQGEPIGKIEDFWINENDSFYHIKVKLSNDFTRLAYVYVVSNNFRTEKDSLEQVTTNR
jgi:rod shape-determining protein MreC